MNQEHSKDIKDQTRGRTQVPGQNPKANDAPDHDLYNDENRQNPFEKAQERNTAKDKQARPH